MLKRNLVRKVLFFGKREYLFRKIADFGNHREFILGYLGKGITLVSIKITNAIRTPKSYQIISKPEKQLLNDYVRTINNTIELSKLPKDTCIEHLSRVLDCNSFREYQVLISMVREG